jgi:pimeloyl-ACP methyl ester carboxylesterase
MTSQHSASPAEVPTVDEPAVERVRVDGVELAYETFGDPADPPLVLVMGLGAQMLAWPDAFCQALADAGHHVVRFDNRDVGLSTHLDDVPPPRLRDLVLRRRRPPYRIDDMADDALGLLDALGIDAAHVVGASMGGFIAQTMALRQPAKVRSLTLIMTSTGSTKVGRARPKVLWRILRRRVATTREEAVSASIEGYRLIGSGGYAFDEEYLRDIAGRAYDRGFDPAGQLRQIWAITAQANRTRDLAGISAPTLVVHGLEDPLVNVSGGLALARAIPRATLVGFHGMGHDLPRALWPDIVRQILALTATAEADAGTVRAAPGIDPGPTPIRRAARWRRSRRG